jgi:hypothetical protein
MRLSAHSSWFFLVSLANSITPPFYRKSMQGSGMYHNSGVNAYPALDLPIIPLLM